MRRKSIKIILFLIILVATFIYSIKWLDEINLKVDKDTIDILIESSNDDSIKKQLIRKLVSDIRETEIANPVMLIANNYKVDEQPTIEKVKKETKEKTQEKKEIIKDPIIYIYNTHQQEKYSSPKELNLNYTVLDGSYYLQKKLREIGIESIVEKRSIQDVLDSNNWRYASSYRVSRMYMEDSKKKNKSLKYYIDLHRDSVSKNISTVEIKGKKYAKVMLLLGLENNNYKKNEINIEFLNKWLNDNYKGISRGIYRKKGKGVNGVYNQDFSDNCFLIEVGGEENTFEEVENTLDVITQMIKYYIGEKDA